MELRDYINMGSQKAGSLTALGKMLDLTQPQISTIKAQKKPLPDKSLVTLAEYLGVAEKELIAANNIAMGKNVDFWRPFVEHAKAASIALAFSTASFFVSPTPANAEQIKDSPQTTLYYAKLAMLRALLKQRQLLRFVKFLQELLIPTRTPQIA